MEDRVSVSSENRCAPVPVYDGPPSASTVGAPAQGEGNGAPTNPTGYARTG